MDQAGGELKPRASSEGVSRGVKGGEKRFQAGIKKDSAGTGGEEGDRSVQHDAEDGLGTRNPSSNNGKERFPVSSSYSKQDGRNYPRLRQVSGAVKSTSTDSKVGSGRLGKNEMWNRPPQAVLGQSVSQGTRAKLWEGTTVKKSSSSRVAGVQNTPPSFDQAKFSVAAREKFVRSNAKPLGSALGSRKNDPKSKASSPAGVRPMSIPPDRNTVGNGAKSSAGGGSVKQNEQVIGGTTNCEKGGGHNNKINTVRKVLGIIIEEGDDSGGTDVAGERAGKEHC